MSPITACTGIYGGKCLRLAIDKDGAITETDDAGVDSLTSSGFDQIVTQCKFP